MLMFKHESSLEWKKSTCDQDDRVGEEETARFYTAALFLASMVCEGDNSDYFNNYVFDIGEK